MEDAFIGAVSMGVIAVIASIVDWALNKWRAGTSWRAAIIVTICILFLPGIVMLIVTSFTGYQF